MSQPHEFEEEEFTTQFNGEPSGASSIRSSHIGRTWSDSSS